MNGAPDDLGPGRCVHDDRDGAENRAGLGGGDLSSPTGAPAEGRHEGSKIAVIPVSLGALSWSRELLDFEKVPGSGVGNRPPHSPTPVPILTVSGAADAKANSLQKKTDRQNRGNKGRLFTARS